MSLRSWNDSMSQRLRRANWKGFKTHGGIRAELEVLPDKPGQRTVSAYLRRIPSLGALGGHLIAGTGTVAPKLMNLRLRIYLITPGGIRTPNPRFRRQVVAFRRISRRSWRL